MHLGLKSRDVERECVVGGGDDGGVKDGGLKYPRNHFQEMRSSPAWNSPCFRLSQRWAVRECDRLERHSRWGGRCPLVGRGVPWWAPSFYCSGAAPALERSADCLHLCPCLILAGPPWPKDGSFSHRHPPCLPGEPHLPVHDLPPPPGPDWHRGALHQSSENRSADGRARRPPTTTTAKSSLTQRLFLESGLLSLLLLT